MGGHNRSCVRLPVANMGPLEAEFDNKEVCPIECVLEDSADNAIVVRTVEEKQRSSFVCTSPPNLKGGSRMSVPI